MTRKRKSYANVEGSNRWEEADGHNSNATFSGKAADDNWCSDFMKNFDKRYGHVEYTKKWKRKGVDDRISSSASDFYEAKNVAEDVQQYEFNSEYPSELVEYMKHVASTIRDNPSMSDDLRRKCLEECKGSEIPLCMYDAPCRLVDEIFSGCRDAARQWMLKIMQSKKEIQLQLLCTSWTCHTLETLLSSLSNTLDTEIVEHWVDLVIENWIQLVGDRNVSHFIRSLAYQLVGLKRKKLGKKEKFPVKDVDQSKKVKPDPAMKESFGRIASVALDYVSMKDMLDDESVSLVLQDVIECDSVVRSGYVQRFVEASCRDSCSVREQWQGKHSSHLWEVIVQKVNEDLRQNLYHSVLEGKLFDFSLHTFANFPVQRYIASAKSDELATDIFDELIEHFEEICDSCKWGIIIALIRMACNRDEITIIKKLRSYFNCSSKSARLAFIPSVFTLDRRISAQFGAMKTFDVAKGQLHGSLILQELMKYEHNKTVVMSLKSLAETTILELARDQKGSFLLQALFRSSTVSRADKELIAKCLKCKWHEIISDSVASHVFDALWESGLYNLKEKEKLMENLSKSASGERSKTMRLMCAKLNLRGFKEQRKKWLKDAEGGSKR